MKNYAIATLSIASMVLPMCALRVTINGRVAGLSQFTSSIHQPMKLPVWPVWSGVIAQCFDWLKAPQISEAITSSIGGRVVPISLSNLDVSPFLLLAHHSHSFTPLDPVRWDCKSRIFSLDWVIYPPISYQYLTNFITFQQSNNKILASGRFSSSPSFRLWHGDLLYWWRLETQRLWRWNYLG